MPVSKRLFTPSLQCVISKNENVTSQYIIVVGKKIQKSAVKRNRIKRIIRAALAEILPTIASPIYCLIVVKKDCSRKKTQDMIKELEILKTI